MNRFLTFLAIISVCTGLVCWQILTQKSDQTPQSSLNDPASTESTATLDAPIPKQEPRALSASQQSEQVLGFTVRKDRNCVVQVHYIPDAETGEIHEAMSCEPLNPEALHPYTSWSDEALAGLTYGDAKAAEILGLRHIHSTDPEEEELGLSLIYRSVALSGDPAAFQAAIGARYAHISINGEPQIKNLKQLFVFNVMGETLGDERFDASIIEQGLRAAEVTESEILRLRTGSRDLLGRMGDLQTEITGSMTIREALENA